MADFIEIIGYCKSFGNTFERRYAFRYFNYLRFKENCPPLAPPEITLKQQRDIEEVLQSII